jgi:membrane-bound metal-dependent hydrolase YbcI (DUF457 family)
MFAIGHFALGYLTGKGSSKLLKTKLNVPLLLAVSVIPDIDLILQMVNPTLFMHRGPAHSIITFTVLMIPFFIIYRKKAIPYYAVLLSHSLIGDFFTGGIEMLWPLSQDWFGNLAIPIGSLKDVAVEFGLFALATAIMFNTKDLQSLLKPKRINLVLLIAFGAVLGPMLPIGHNPESSLSALLLIPSVFWLVIFAYSILVELLITPEKPPSAAVAGEHAG